MVSITIDHIVRRFITQNQLSLHYYLPVLSFALRGLKQLHYDSLHKLKAVELDVVDDEASLASLTDVVDIVAVGAQVGDKIRKMGQDKDMNLLEDGNPFPEADSTAEYNSVLDSNVYRYGQFSGGFYGRPIVYTDEYRVLADKNVIRLSNRTELTKVYVLYLASATSTTVANVVHPYAEEALLAYLEYSWAKYKAEPLYVSREYKKDFHNEARRLKRRMNKISITDIRRVVRKSFRVPKS